jgi:hypothetical protein
VPSETARWLQQGGAAGGGLEDRMCRRGSSNSSSCIRDDRQQVSGSTGGLSGGLVDGKSTDSS